LGVVGTTLTTTMTIAPETWALWGKADPKRASGHGGPEWHPLLCHLVDVVVAAERLLTEVRPDRLVALARALGLREADAAPWLLFFVGLHDLGKATPSFQAKVDRRRLELERLGFDFPEGDKPHGQLSVPLARRALEGAGVPRPLALSVAKAVGAHHGEFVPPMVLAKLVDRGDLLASQRGKAPLWKTVRANLVEVLGGLCGISVATPRPAPLDGAPLHSFVADLAGLTTVADWLGSNADVFEYVSPPASLGDYARLARERAKESIEVAGWRRPPVSPRRSFEELFGKKPWPLHAMVSDILPRLEGPSLLVVEAPMGEGKTEAALSVFDALASRGASGLYFALPTQATSNQIFGRVERFLRGAFPGETHGLHLVHGDSGLSDAYEALKERAFRVRSVGDVGSDQGPVADAWFARSKRALLAPIAVGTVDQALMGVLGVKHAFLRLHGLAGKVLVIDEVHAYDTYTSQLLERLLAWAHALGTTVVLLSATLPADRRAALLRAYGADSAPPATYPRITVASAGRATSVTFPSRRAPVPVSLVWQQSDEVAARLAETISDGGCAAWIVNTVREAQRTFLRLRHLQREGRIAADVTIDLLHARFPFAARAQRERAAEASFGPGEDRRPRAAILVGTQVLEQSLDLDFDVMVTQVAPIDLVLQRAGRLHRHLRSWRPERVHAPALWLVRPEHEDRATGPEFGASAYVYSEAILLRTWLALRERTEITLPEDIEGLIETVYGGGPVPQRTELAARVAKLDADDREGARADGNKAHAVVLRSPETEDDPFGELASVYDDEDPAIHPALRPVTRLGDPSVDVIPIVDEQGRSLLAGNPSVVIDLWSRDPLPRSVVVAAARQSVGLSHRTVVAALLKENPPPAFAAAGHLRYHRVLRLDTDGRTEIGGVPLHLDPDLGLVVGSLDLHADDASEGTT